MAEHFLPFPDLTGLRTRAYDRHRSGRRMVVAKHTLQVRPGELERTARDLGSDVAVEELFVAAWTVVLLHLLSPEDVCCTSTSVLESGTARTLNQTTDRERRCSMALIKLIEAQRTSSHTDPSSTPDNALLFALPSDGDCTSAVNAFAFRDSHAWHLEIHASAQLHSEGSAKLHLEQIDALLRSICADPFSPAFALDRFHYSLRAGDNPHPITLLDDFRCDSTAGERFEYQFETRASQFPDRIALDFREDPSAGAGDRARGNVLLTYREVEVRTRAIAGYIRRRLSSSEPGSNRIVALCLEKSQWTYLAILAVLKADAAWCPIDTDWPVARRQALLAKSRAKVVLTAGTAVRQSLEAIVPEDVDVISLDTLDIDVEWKEDEKVDVEPRGSSEELAYLIWTSGTTGLPKAVGIQHKAAVQALRSLQRVIPYDKNDTSTIRYLQFSAYNFDLMILDMFYTWGLGGTLCSSTRSVLLTNLVDIVKSFEASHTLLTPAVMAMTPRGLLPSLRVVINGGEKLSQVVADMWSVDCCLLNLYGPAEATLIAMNRRVPVDDVVKAPNIGRALATTSCHAVGVDDEVVLKGAVGQLVLGGFQCALGYIGDEEKTADKFVEHGQLGRIYKTGDMVRQLWNGEFEYLGRSDDQVKINGIRIELLEINAAIRSAADQVRDSETLVMPNEKDDSDVRIVNFSVIPCDGDQTQQLIRLDRQAATVASTLVEQARKSLPTYMVPSLFVIVNRFPKTSSAKIDREALKAALKSVDVIAWQNSVAECAPDAVELADGDFDDAQRGVLVELVAIVCGITAAQVGLYTPLSSLGLDSIRAIGLVRRLNEAGLAVSVVDVLTHNSVALLLRHMNSGQAQMAQSKVDDTAAKLCRFSDALRHAVQASMGDGEQVQKVLPATPLQESLIAETRLVDSRYWLHRVYETAEGVPSSEVEEAVNALTSDIDVLRIAFISLGELDQALPSNDFQCGLVQALLQTYSSPIKRLSVLEGTSDESIAATSRTAHSLDVTARRPPVAFSIVAEPPRLVMHIHHALYDQISLETIQDALIARLRGTTFDFQASSFVEALPHLVTSSDEDRQEQLSAWDRLLGDYPKGTSMQVPSLSSRRDVRSGSEVEAYRIDTAVSYSSLAAAATALGSTPRALVQAVLCILLARLSGTPNVLLGDAISGRAVSHALDRIIGPVLSTLPVSMAVRPGTSFEQLCVRLATYYNDALPHAQVSLAKIRQLLQLPRSSDTFQAMFVFEPPSEESDGAVDRHLLRYKGDFGVSVEHPVAFEVSFTRSKELVISLLVRSGITDGGMANVVLRQCSELLNHFLRSPEQDVFSLPVPEEPILARSSFDAPASLQREARSPVFAPFIARALGQPDVRAVQVYDRIDEEEVEPGQSLSYGQLCQRSKLLAQYLIASLPAKSVIAVTLTRSLDTYIALLAVLMAGHVYLPVDVTVPEARKVMLLEDSGAACLLCHTGTCWLEEKQRQTVVIKLDELEHGEVSGVDLPELDPSDTAYILYTSGSTGMPKGCKLSHGNLSATLASFRAAYDTLAPGSFRKDGVRFLARSIETFDVSLLEILLPLQIGGTVVTASRQLLLSNLGKAMQSLRITHAAVVPSLFTIDARPVRPADLPDLRALIVGGERIQRQIIDNWAGSTVPLLNAYGPTEACIGTSIARLQPGDSTGSIGRPFISTQYVILTNPTGKSPQIALRGEAGELCIGGLQVGSYLNGVNADSFVVVDEVRYYRTGDEARMWPDDTIEYLGRIGGSDAQVKIRGVRIELGEIDSVFARTQRAADYRFATQLVTQPGSKDERLVTFFARSTSVEGGIALCRDAGIQGSIKTLLSAARLNLPSSMSPSALIPLDRLPLAPLSGKIDRKGLQRWYEQLGQEEIQALRCNPVDVETEDLSESEGEVLKLVRHLLKTDELIGSDTDLFSIGMDSLKVIQLAGLIEKRYKVAVDIGKAMSDTTLRTFASFLTQNPEVDLKRKRKEDVQAEWVKVKAAAADRLEGRCKVLYAMPCLPLQESMIAQSVLDREDARSTIRYLNHVRFQVAGVAQDTLDRALEQVLLRHDIYRTVFHDIDGGWTQAVVDTPEPAYRYGGEDRNGEDWFESAQKDVIDNIDVLPPIRYRISPGSDAVVLELALHHAVYDGESIVLLLQEVGQLCTGQGGLSLTTERYSDVVASALSTPTSQRVQYWKDRLSPLTVVHFPCLTGRRPSQRVEQAKSVTLRSSSPLKQTLSSARQQGVTLPMLLLHEFARLYGLYTGDADVILGLVLNGRTSVSVHGPCVNTVPFGIKLDDADCLARIKRDFAEAFTHQHVPLTQLGRELQSANGLFNCLFSFLSGQGGGNGIFTELSSEMLTGVPLALEVSVNEAEDALRYQLAFDPTHIPPEQADMILRQLDQQVCRNEKPEVDLLSVCNPDSTPTTIPHFLDFFAEQVAMRPDDTAFEFVEDMDGTSACRLSYRHLDERSNAVAEVLRSRLHSASAAPVGVFMAQCAEVYVVLLGLWKSGSTYLPLDPKLPMDRLEYIVSVAKPKLVIALDGAVEKASRLTDDVVSFTDLLRPPTDHGSSHPTERHPIDVPAYLMFTSGSSGKPKGVQVSHRALGATLLSWREILPHRPGESRMLQLASPGFDVFLIEVCMPLAFGFAFVSAPKAVLLDDLEMTFNRLSVSIADLPAALAVTVDPQNVPPLEWLMSGGDLMDQRVIDTWTEVGLINAWGPTEATIGNTLGFVRRTDVSRNWIGYAYPTSTILVLDPLSREILPRGCVGELAVSGPQVGDGYFGNEELTRQKFLDILLPGARETVRMYRTGDLGRVLYDGGVECLGRIDGDGQVKINSQRVELKEIEIALCRQEDVHDACVLYLDHDGMASKQLVAFLILQGGEGRTTGLLVDQSEKARNAAERAIEQLSLSLPSYMVPRLGLALQGHSLPLTSNGKTDTKTLKAFFAGLELGQLTPGHKQEPEEDAEPLTEVERSLRSILAHFTGVEEARIGRDTSLHRLGVDSISAFRLAKRLREASFVGVSARDVLSSPTIEALALAIGSGGRKESDEGIAITVSKEEERAFKIDDGDAIVAVLPCTSLQEGMLLESIRSQGRLYVHRQRLQTDQMQYVDGLIGAFERLVGRHEMLRTSFHAYATTTGVFVQVIHADTRAHVEIREFGAADDPAPFLSAARFASEEELTRPPVDLRIARMADRAIVSLTLHHALYDGESLERLLGELEEETRAGSSGGKTATPFRAVLPYLLSSDSACEYWTATLQDRRDSTIQAADRERTGASCLVHGMEMERVSVEGVEGFAKRHGVSVHTVALFAFSKLLASLTGQRDVTFAQTFSLRDAAADEDGREVFGPCLNTCLTPVDIVTEETVIEALQRIQRQNDEGRRHRNASLVDVQRRLQRLRGRGLDFDALFDMQRIEEAETKGVMKRIEDEEGIGSTQYALNVEFIHRPDGMELVASAHASCFDDQSLLRAMRMLEEIIIHTVGSTAASLATDMPDGAQSLAPLSIGRHIVSPMETEEGSGSDTQVEEGYEEGKASTALHGLLLRSIAEIAGLKKHTIDTGVALSRMGMDSIACMRLASRLRRQGVTVGLIDIMQGKTVNGIVRRIQARQDVVGDDQGVAVVKRSQDYELEDGRIEDVVDALPGQLFQLADTESAYTFYYRIKETVDVVRMKEAWILLCRHHACLRTGFMLEGGIKQVVWSPDADLDVHFKVLELDDPVRQLHSNELQDQLACQFTAHQPPRACFVVKDRSESGEDVIVLRLHHALYDAISLPVLAGDLYTVYSKGRLDPIHGASFIDFSRQVARSKTAKEMDARRYWTDLFSGAPASVLGADRGSDGLQSFIFLRGKVAGVAKLQSRINRLAGLPALVLAAWARTLARLTGQPSAVFGVYRQGRSAALQGIESMVGNCMNVLPVVVRPTKDLANDIHEQLDEQREWEDVTSVLDIARWTGHERLPWNSYVNLLWPTDKGDEEQDKAGLEPIEDMLLRPTSSFHRQSSPSPLLPDPRSDFNIDVQYDLSADALHIGVKWTNALFTREQVEGIIDEMCGYIRLA